MYKRSQGEMSDLEQEDAHRVCQGRGHSEVQSWAGHTVSGSDSTTEGTKNMELTLKKIPKIYIRKGPASRPHLTLL